MERNKYIYKKKIARLAVYVLLMIVADVSDRRQLQ